MQASAASLVSDVQLRAQLQKLKHIIYSSFRARNMQHCVAITVTRINGDTVIHKQAEHVPWQLCQALSVRECKQRGRVKFTDATTVPKPYFMS